MLSIRQLQALVAVSEAEHFGLAAARLGIGTAAVSGLVARLERTVGITLVRRTSRRVALTAAGMSVAARARVLIAMAEGLTGHVDAVRAGTAGTVRVGIEVGIDIVTNGDGAVRSGGVPDGTVDPGGVPDGVAVPGRAPDGTVSSDGARRGAASAVVDAVTQRNGDWAVTRESGTAAEIGERFEAGHLDVLVTRQPHARRHLPWWHKPWQRERARRDSLGDRRGRGPDLDRVSPRPGVGAPRAARTGRWPDGAPAGPGRGPRAGRGSRGRTRLR
ncbi:MAG: LysR family transcriptional regulator [Solirubrobacteraceae bacterium]